MKWTYESEEDNFRAQKNEVVTLLDPSNADWYKVRTLLTDDVGYVPSVYLKKIEKKAKAQKSHKEAIAEAAASWKTEPAAGAGRGGAKARRGRKR